MNNSNIKGGERSADKLSKKARAAVAIIVLLAVCVATALSMHLVRSNSVVVEKKPAEMMTRKSPSTGRNYVTANAYGQHVVADRITGEVRPLTQDEASRLAAGLKQLIDQSTDGLVTVSQDDGTISMDLQGHFQNVMLAKRESDGTVSHECVDNLESAANYFEIDPKLVGINKPLTASRPMPKLEDR